jgi:ABC-type transporter Mla subunit MlaD
VAGLRRIQVSVGLLVVAGLVLLVGFVLFATRESFTRGDTIFETYFRESVQGLEVGSPVRYRGVAVGRISEISLASAQYRRPQGETFAGAFQLVVVRFAVDLRQTGDVPSLGDAVSQGLRARLATTGITGVIYIELDFLDPERYPAQTLPWQPQYTFVPAVPSTTAQVQTAAETLLRRFEDVDLKAVLDNVTGLVADARALVGNDDLATVLREAAELIKEVRAMAGQTDLPGVVTELRGTVAAVRGVVDSPELRETLAQAAAAMTDLRRATARLPATVNQLETVLRSARGVSGDLQAEIAPLLRDLRATTANLRETSEALRRSPSQALFGSPPPPRLGR